ncbi:pyridoxamine 5'-phosphate oxidase family protein [Streptomyces sp. NPDC050703]|uniref:pyridoxamine 5'-phosphate oxidase family protein n=1 Tax=Streptomyces sp. NPDC050703 TaxID=3157218 RepID=UPI0034420C25
MSFNQRDLGTAEPVGWEGFVAAEPVFAATVQSRFDAFVHHTLATLRKDGSPRTSGIEVRFLHGELCLGMMPGSLKALDLRRDPRFALQANLGSDAEMTEGDARITGRAVEVRDPRVIARYADAVQPPDPDAFHLFRTELTEVVRTYIEDGKYLAVQLWKPGAALRTTRRT